MKFLLLKRIREIKGPFALDDNDITFLLSSANGLICNHAIYFFLSSELGAAPIPDDKYLHLRRQVRTDSKRSLTKQDVQHNVNSF